MDISDAPSQRGPGHKPAPTGDSLLASLLNETSEEANRELQEVQDRLRERRLAEEEVRRKDEDTRRRALDALREQESRRREDKLREREGGPIPVTRANPVAAFVPSPIAPVAKKSPVGWIVAVVAVLAAGGVGVGWYVSSQNAAEQARIADADKKATAAALAAQNKKEREIAEAAKDAAEKSAAAAMALAQKLSIQPRVEGRDPEDLVAPSRERRPLELVGVLAVLEPTKPAHSGGHRTGPKGEDTKTGDGGKPIIKIKGLDLGGTK